MRKALTLAYMVGLLSGCTYYPAAMFPAPIVEASVAAPRGPILVIRNSETGTLALVSPGTTMNFALVGFTGASIAGAWQNGANSLIVLTGPTVTCPGGQYIIADVGPKNVEGTQLGTCGVAFAVQEQANSAIAGRQIGSTANTPLIWTYLNRQLVGPEPASVFAGSRSDRPGELANENAPVAPLPQSVPLGEDEPAFSTLNRVNSSLAPQAVTVPDAPAPSIPAVKLDDN